MKILSAILCDEVRKEDTGKFLIIGAYANDVLAQKFPAQFPLTLWLHLSPPEKEKLSLELRIKDKNKPRRLLASARGTITVEDPSRDIFVTFPKMLVSLENPAILVLELKQNSGRWRKIREIPVKQVP